MSSDHLDAIIDALKRIDIPTFSKRRKGDKKAQEGMLDVARLNESYASRTHTEPLSRNRRVSHGVSRRRRDNATRKAKRSEEETAGFLEGRNQHHKEGARPYKAMKYDSRPRRIPGASIIAP